MSGAIYDAIAVVPARSGSKGIRDKNIRQMAGKPLMAYSIEFAKKLGVRAVWCSTDSEQYAEIAQEWGADVPFLRSAEAASDSAMEEHILVDLYDRLDERGIAYPKYWIWLRPTFVFRRKNHVLRCLEMLEQDAGLTAARTVCPSENRLYEVDHEGRLNPLFDDHGKSMIRRQDMPEAVRVFSTDVFRGDFRNDGSDFLGRRVGGIVTDRVCGLDIDDELDFALVEALIEKHPEMVREYL